MTGGSLKLPTNPDMSLIRKKLEEWGKVAWIPILVIASLSLFVSFLGYRLTVSGIAPRLEFNGGDLNSTNELRLYWLNAGRRNAWHAKAKLFSFSEADKRGTDPLGEAEIMGAGGKVFAGLGGTADYRLSGVPKRLLVCVTYDDDENRPYEQVFLVSVRGVGGQSVVEERPPIGQSCS